MAVASTPSRRIVGPPTVPEPRSPSPRPMQTSAGAPPRGPGWAFEFSWDGLRCLVHARAGRLRLVTAGGRDVTASFPELDVVAGRATGHGLVLDGVVVAQDSVGRPSRPRLRRRLGITDPSTALRARMPVSLFVVDVLEIDGRSTARLPYRHRRSLLVDLDLAGSPVVVPPSFTDVEAEAVMDTARRYGLDGIVAKRLESTYQAGRRSRSWIETPVRRTQEVVVGGWVPGPRHPDTAGSLLVGVPTEAGLRYTGRVATGVTAAARREFHDAAAGLERAASPFRPDLADAIPQARWLAPRLVGHVEHRRWTPTGLLERPAWRGLRRGTHPAAVQAPVLATPVVDTDLALDDLQPADRPGPARTGVDVITTAPPDEGEAALRSRFSQHFVHNTLTAIAAYVRTDPGRARDLLTEFADFTRYSFRSGGELTTVGEEFDNAERYLTLERARFGARLRVEVSREPEVVDVELPAFVVSPLVENAVRHGIEPRPGGGTVRLRAAVVGGDCVITVADDGAGMAPEAARAAAHGEPHGGLAEVSRRLRGEFGGADLTVDARPGAGTTVRVRVPVRTAPRPVLAH